MTVRTDKGSRLRVAGAAVVWLVLFITVAAFVFQGSLVLLIAVVIAWLGGLQTFSLTLHLRAFRLQRRIREREVTGEP